MAEKLRENTEEHEPSDEEKTTRRNFLRKSAEVGLGIMGAGLFELEAKAGENDIRWPEAIGELSEKGIKVANEGVVDYRVGKATRITAEKDGEKRTFHIIYDQKIGVYNVFCEHKSNNTIATGGQCFTDIEVKNAGDFMNFLLWQFDTLPKKENLVSKKLLEKDRDYKSLRSLGLRLDGKPYSEELSLFPENGEAGRYEESVAIVEAGQKTIKVFLSPKPRNARTIPLAVIETSGNLESAYFKIWKEFNDRNLTSEKLGLKSSEKFWVVNHLINKITEKAGRKTEAMPSVDGSRNLLACAIIFDKETGARKGIIEIGGSDNTGEFKYFVFNNKNKLLATFKADSQELEAFLDKI